LGLSDPSNQKDVVPSQYLLQTVLIFYQLYQLVRTGLLKVVIKLC